MQGDGRGAGAAAPIQSTRRETLMPPKSWSARRERQYEHIKEGEKDRGRSEKTAERIAAATVNKTRSEHGETKESKRS